MNEQQFVSLLSGLEDSQWRSVLEGQAILMVNDLELELGDDGSANAIISASQDGSDTIVSLKEGSLRDAAELLQNYYLTHPLTLKGFNCQVEQLLEKHGARAFAAPIGQLPQFTLFVEGGEVLAEPSGSPRHRYGAFCELGHSVEDSAINARVSQWLETGEAHERYLGMNVCRYNC